jgi:hypothetical protein
LIRDHKDKDLLSALELYERRIPESERFEAPDIVRWLREDLEQRARGAPGPRDHFVVAKRGDEVCGFALVHFYPHTNLAFVAYLVAEKGVSVDGSAISQNLVDFVFELFNNGEKLKDYRGFVLEVDDPALAVTERERKRRLARIRLFCTLAERNGLPLKALDFDYRQPPLTIPEDTESGQELPMLLMFAGKSKGQKGWMEKEEVSGLLDFICNSLYPEGFSDVPQENEQYRAYTSKLCLAQIATLPEQVRTLSFAQIRARRTRTKVNSTMARSSTA